MTQEPPLIKSPRQDPAACIKKFAIAGLMANGESRARLGEMATSRAVLSGQTLFWEDDAVSHSYLLIDGAMKAYTLLPNGRSQIVRFPISGELIAPPVFKTHNFTCQALNDCAIVQLPRTRFDDLLQRDPALMRSLADMLSRELQQTQKQVLLLGRMPAVERVSTFLLDMIARKNPETVEYEPDLAIELPMSRTDLADYLGLTVETVSRVFSRLRRDRLIDLPRPNLIVLRDQSGLQRHCCLSPQ